MQTQPEEQVRPLLPDIVDGMIGLLIIVVLRGAWYSWEVRALLRLSLASMEGLVVPDAGLQVDVEKLGNEKSESPDIYIGGVSISICLGRIVALSAEVHVEVLPVVLGTGLLEVQQDGIDSVL